MGGGGIKPCHLARTIPFLTRSDTGPHTRPVKAANRPRGVCETQWRVYLRGKRTHEPAPGSRPRGTPTQGHRRVANLQGFLLAIVAGTAFNESRQRLDLESKVPCTLALAVVTRT